MKVTINRENMECSEGCTYRELAQQVQGAYAHRIVLEMCIRDRYLPIERIYPVKD